SMLAMVVNDDEGYLNARVVLAFFASMLAPTGPATLDHTSPSAAKPASMPVYPLRRTGTKPLEVGKKIKSQNEAA
ncbi:hypothetical protein PMI35_05481, partial [Pseudomonas sp. GM78]